MKTLSIFSTVLVILLLSINVSNAQRWINYVDSTEASNFYGYQKAFNKFWKGKNVEQEEELNCQEGGWQQFKRWEAFMEPRVYPSGNFISPSILWDEWNKYKSKNKGANTAKGANWTLTGPSVVPANGGGNGRLNCICFHPADPNTFWTGAPNGGIWKTTDGGNTWASLALNLLPNLSIADIAVDPVDPDIMYIATGDGYGYEVDYFWGGTYSAGVLKSTDGGLSWNATGLTYLQSDNNIIQKLVVCKSNPQILLASARDGLWRSADAGVSWTAVMTSHFYDIKFNVLTDSVIYASSEKDVYKSTDMGISWNKISNGLNPDAGRISLAVTQANPLVIYAFCNSSYDNYFYKSSDGGATFQTMSSPDGTGYFYGYYDMVLAASPTNENTVYAGGLDVIKSVNGGQSWTKVSRWDGWPASDYVHADNHDIEFLPGSGNIVFSCNDGGIFISTDGAATWKDITNNLAITQFYRIGSSETNPGLIYAGAQDNGTVRYDGATWTQVNFCDGMESIVDYSDPNTVYVSCQYGYLQKSTDGGNTFIDISPASAGYGSWITPYVIHPTDPQILFAGYADVYKTTDGGFSWNAISFNLTGGTNTLNLLAVAESNTGYIYAGTWGNLYMTSNGGANWSDITAGLPVANSGITAVAVSDSDPQSLWVTFSGYASGEKVYFSSDGGKNWSNISGTLPNIPVNCIVHEKSNNDALYIGTDFGVFYTDNSHNDWLPYNTGLPNVIIDELEIHYGASELRAATYGCGLWTSPLNSSALFNTDAGVYAITSVSAVSCDSTINPVIKIKNYGINTLTSLTLNYSIDGGTVNTVLWTGSLTTNAYDLITLPSLNAGGGSHNITAFTSYPNGLPDGNSANDSKTFYFTVVNTGQALPLTEDFEGSSFPANGWTATKWTKFTSAGGFGNSYNSAVMDFYFLMPPATGIMTTDFINFNNYTPLKLSFDVAYARYDDTYTDTLAIKISGDCGKTWSQVWSEGGAQLATAPDYNYGPFEPAADQWRTETIDLSPYAAMKKAKLMFEGISGYGNNLYIDNINFSSTYGINNNNNDYTVNVYPNPSAGRFFVDINYTGKTAVSVTVYNAIGENVKHINCNAGNLKQHVLIDLSDKGKGLYLVKIETGNVVINRMVTVN